MKLMKTVIASSILVCTASVNAGTLYSVSESNDTLVSIDTSSLSITQIGSLGVSFDFGGLAYDSNSNTMYMIGGRNNNNLYTVDLNTGSASLIGSHGINDLFGLAYDTRNDVLYAGTRYEGHNLFSLDVNTGSSSLIGSTGGYQMDGLAYNANTDTLLALGGGDGDVVSINRSTAQGTLLYDGDFINNNGFAYDSENNLYWAIDWSGDLYSYDPDSSYSRSLATGGLGAHDGLAYVAAVPEPSTYALMLGGLGLVGFMAARRRKA